MRSLLVAAAFVAVHCGPAQAQTAEPDAATIAAAQKFVATLDMEGNYRAMIGELVDGLSEGMAKTFEEKTNQEFPPQLLTEFRAILSSQLDKAYRENSQALLKGTALVHARHFSLKELERLTVLMNDPVMRRYTQSTQKLAPELGTVWEMVIGDRYRAETEGLIEKAVISHFERAGTLSKPVS